MRFEIILENPIYWENLLLFNDQKAFDFKAISRDQERYQQRLTLRENTLTLILWYKTFEYFQQCYLQIEALYQKYSFMGHFFVNTVEASIKVEPY